MSDGAFCHYCKRAASVCMCGVTVNPAKDVQQATNPPAPQPDLDILRMVAKQGADWCYVQTKFPRQWLAYIERMEAVFVAQYESKAVLYESSELYKEIRRGRRKG